MVLLGFEDGIDGEKYGEGGLTVDFQCSAMIDDV